MNTENLAILLCVSVPLWQTLTMNTTTDTIQDFDLTEIIQGEKRMAPSPFGYHQKIVFNLAYEFRNFLEDKNLGEVFLSPLDVILEEGKFRLQPDLIYLKKENLHLLREWIYGTPDLVIEVVSKGTLTRDSVEKKEIYENFGVIEFWLVFPEIESFEVFTLVDGKYKLHASTDYTPDSIGSKLIGGLAILPDKIFVK